MNNIIAAESFDALRARLSQVGRASGMASLGADAIDARLGGGVALGALHELFASVPEDAAAATGFALMLALRAAKDGRSLLWLRDDAATRLNGRIDGEGLAALGADPAQLVITQAEDVRALLKAALDALRCDRLGAVILEARGKTREIDLIATRRLSLAARTSGVTLFTARIEAQPAPSAAWTRWRVLAAPSTPLEGNAPGHPAFDVALLRDRGGCPPFSARLEWDGDARAFFEARLSGSLASFPAIGAPARAA